MNVVGTVALILDDSLALIAGLPNQLWLYDIR